MIPKFHINNEKNTEFFIPAEEPTNKILSEERLSQTHLQTATTSLISENPVREGLPVDLPAPLMSKVTAL